MSSSKAPLSIAIIGAGLAGTTLAIALSKHNPSFQITIYESRPHFSEAGASIGFGANAVRAMKLIDAGIFEAYEKIQTHSLGTAKDLVSFECRYGEGERFGETIGEIRTLPGYRDAGCSRQELLNQFIEVIPKTVKLCFDKKVVDVSTDPSTGRKLIQFEDGEKVLTDAVIGCDGIRSACRRILLGSEDESVKAVYSGMYVYRKLVPMEKALAAAGPSVQERIMYCGQEGHILLLPVARGKVLSIVAFKHAEGAPWTDQKWTVPAGRDEVLADFKGWGQRLTRLLELVDETDKWGLFDHKAAPTYAKGNFCIIGDAAHSTTPHSGSGAGLAIEDVHMLSGLLTPDRINSAADIGYAFKAYDEIRRPRTQELVVRSRQNGMLCELHDTDGSPITKDVLIEKLSRNLMWVWSVDLASMLEEAKALVDTYEKTE